ANQVLLVDGGTAPTGVSVISSFQDDLSDPGGNGWAGVPVPNTPPACPYTQVFNITLPYPPPNLSLVKIADGSTANPGDLVLFRLDYVYGNTGPVTITDSIPAGTTLAAPTGAISPGGTLSGSTITWVFPASLPSASGEAWFLTKVNAGVAAGTVLTNTASAGSASTGTVNSNQAQVNIGVGGFTLMKSQSSASLNSGNTVTYTLNYQVSGER